jgi:hypothetical protein
MSTLIECKRAADVVTSRIAQVPGSSTGPSALKMALKQLERERRVQGERMATFIKALEKQMKSTA